jgi:two-component system NtrC family response regulator
VCATNRDLAGMVAEGTFREDLYFRINTFELALPPLRERPDDIAPLARHLAARSGARLQPDDPLLDDAALAALRAHPWPGNVRELANAIEHALILCDSLPITTQDLPTRLGHSPSGGARDADLSEPCTLRELEMRAIHAAMDRHQENKPAVAEELGISLKTLYNKLNQAEELRRSA